MSQNDMIIANADGVTVRADINSVAQALASNSKGNAAPGTPYAGQFWLDDDSPSATVWTLNLYDGTDWIPVGTFDVTNNVFYAAGVTQTNANILAPHKGLVVQYGDAAHVTLTATEVVLFNTSGHARRFASLSESLDITASGANGLDDGSEASGTWYHVWAIGKTDGTLDGLLSISATAPTMPSGYTFKGYLGAAYNNGSSNFEAFFQRGPKVTRLAVQVLNAGTQTTYTAVSLAAAVPTTAASVYLAPGVNASSGTATVTLAVAPAGSTTTATYGESYVRQMTGSTTTFYGAMIEVLMTTAQQVVYYVSGTNARGYIDVEGWSY